MTSRKRLGLLVLAVLLSLGLGRADRTFAQGKPGMEGWDLGGKYDQFYDSSEFDDFKGVVEEIVEITPLAGMAPGVGLVVRDQDGDKVNVQVGPKSFVKVDAIGLKKGDKVKVKGVWAEIEGQEIFMASKVKKGDDLELKVRRTKDGVPFWTLSPEELAKEGRQEDEQAKGQ